MAEEQSLESGPATVLEVLATSRKASSGWLLGLLTGQHETQPSLATPAAVRKILEEAVSAGLVHRVEMGKSGEWFQMPNCVRRRFLPPACAATVHASVADELEGDELRLYVELAAEDDPELFHELLERAMVHRLKAGDMQNAVQCYWQRLGNFSRLGSERAFHLGARACCTLNAGRPPHQISPALKEVAEALAVINDWGVHAICVGDAKLASEGALAAHGMIAEDLEPWNKSTLARHVAEALLLRGRLPEAMQWAERAKQHALASIRMNEGLPTEEVMSAYDHAFYAIMKIAAGGHDACGAAQVLSEMVEVHSRARELMSEFNRSAIFPLPGPSGEVNAEELLDGRPAAMVALLAGRPGDALRILTPQLARWSQERLDSRQGLEMRTLVLRAQMADERNREAGESIVQLRHLADELDDTAARCELASIAAGLALVEGNAEASLALADDFVDLASNCDLGLLRNDLLKVRSKALRALGRVEEARASDEDIQKVAAAPVVEPPRQRRQRAKAAEESRRGEPEQRLQLHEASLSVIEDYNTQGLPFALYFRTYSVIVAHGPLEFGPQMIETVLHEAMPPGAHVLTVQDPDLGPLYYSGLSSHFYRSAPGLYLEDEHWQEILASLIPFADLIVAEWYALTEGVRFELDVAYRTNRWDRTVLLLPPPKGYLSGVHSDPLIQKFPRCIWIDSFDTGWLTDSPVVRDLITRMAEIAGLPEDARRRLTDRAARDEAYPIDLLPIAVHYERSAMRRRLRQDEDDRIRNYVFWELFRAASIRRVRMLRGDESFDNRMKLYDAYMEMSEIVLDHEREGDKIILIGDLTFAEQCAQSARALIRESDGPAAFASRRKRAENRLQSVLQRYS
jgi:hypothetical protein